MWVDIANLMGPKGADGADGQRGEPGPVNIGLNPDEPIAWDQSGGFTFNFVDGSEQTVNLPIASAQSAGLQSPASAYDSGWRNIRSLSPGAVSGNLRARRVGHLVEIVAETLKLQGASGSQDVVMPLGPGWRPLTPVYFESIRYWSTSEDAAMRVWVDSTVRAALDTGQDHELFFHVAYTTRDTPPASLPGTAV